MLRRPTAMILVPDCGPTTAGWRRDQECILATAAVREGRTPLVPASVPRFLLGDAKAAQDAVAHDLLEEFGASAGKHMAAEAWVLLPDDRKPGRDATAAYLGWRVARQLTRLPPAHGQPGLRMATWAEWAGLMGRTGLGQRWQTLGDPDAWCGDACVR